MAGADDIATLMAAKASAAASSHRREKSFLRVSVKGAASLENVGVNLLYVVSSKSQK